ncbi:ABC transporter permease [Singulisphaera rosea]
MGVAEIVYDNPILIKHVRSRLRPGQALPWGVVVLVLAACITWMGINVPWVGNTSAVAMLLGIQILALTFGGSNQINSSLGGARETGILDYHRVSPLPPAVIALGFFFGAPIREYALAAICLPFALFSAHLVDVNDPWKGIHWFAQLEVAFLVTTWLAQAVTMLGCLTRKKPRGSMHGTIVTVFFMLFLSYLGSFGIYFGTRWLLDESPRLNFCGAMLPWLGWLLIYEVPLFGFLGLAVVRKTKAERTHSYTKLQALACMMTLAVLSIGGLWDVARLMWPLPPTELTPADAIMIAAVYVFSVVAMLPTKQGPSCVPGAEGCCRPPGFPFHPHVETRGTRRYHEA